MGMAEIQPLDLNKRTVFILGAGASRPYDFPLGTELKAQMIGNLSRPTCLNILAAIGFEESLVNDFSESLSRTYHPTIDIFLEKKTKFRSLGAYLIAYTLLPIEIRSNLFPQHDWYGHLYNVIDFEHDEPDSGKIVFVSLNYDRSLEHFLTKNVQYNCPDALITFAESKLKRLEIIHAHGSLGRYPEIPYGSKPTNQDVLCRAAEGIRIVSDRLEDSEDFNTARRAILNADNLVFIGFGFDSITLNKLIQGINLSNMRILGSAFQLDPSRREHLTNFFEGKIEKGEVNTTAEKFVQRILLYSPHT